MAKRAERVLLTGTIVDLLEKEYAVLREKVANDIPIPKGLPFRHLEKVLNVPQDTLARWYSEGGARNATDRKAHYHEIVSKVFGLFQDRWEQNICKIADDLGNRNSFNANERLLERTEKQIASLTPKQSNDSAIPPELMDLLTDEELAELEQQAKRQAELLEQLRLRQLHEGSG